MKTNSKPLMSPIKRKITQAKGYCPESPTQRHIWLITISGKLVIEYCPYCKTTKERPYPQEPEGISLTHSLPPRKLEE